MGGCCREEVKEFFFSCFLFLYIHKGPRYITVPGQECERRGLWTTVCDPRPCQEVGWSLLTSLRWSWIWK